MDSSIFHRKMDLIIEMLKDGDTDTLSERAGLYAATRLLLDDVDSFLENEELRYDVEGFNYDYVTRQARTLRSYIGYYLGFANAVDVTPGDAKNALHYSYLLKSQIPQ